MYTKLIRLLQFVIVFSFITLIVTGVYFFRRNFLLKPSINVLGTENTPVVVKNPNKVSYGFLPYWTIESYVPNFNSVTDIAYFSFYLHPDGTIIKRGEDGNADPSYNQWRNNAKLHKILDSARKHNVRTSLTVALHVNDEIEEFLNCGEYCWETSYKELDKEISWGKINGLNFDFEYVGEIPSGLDYKYTAYIEYISSRLKNKYGSEFVTSVSTYGNAAYKERLMNIKQYGESENIDYIFIMAYDFYTRGSATSGPLAPIGGAPINYGYDLTMMTRDYLLKSPSEKLILGIPLYGYNWVVSSNSPFAERVEGNDYIGYSISQFYEHIKDFIVDNKVEVLWDEHAQSPYYTYTSDTGALRQVYYEDTRSIAKKIEIAQEKHFGGVGVWALGYDGKNIELSEMFKNYLIY